MIRSVTHSTQCRAGQKPLADHELEQAAQQAAQDHEAETQRLRQEACNYQDKLRLLEGVSRQSVANASSYLNEVDVRFLVGFVEFHGNSLCLNELEVTVHRSSGPSDLFGPLDPFGTLEPICQSMTWTDTQRQQWCFQGRLQGRCQKRHLTTRIIST